MISSAQNAKVKLVRALAGRARERREAGAFLAEGVRLVEEALAAGWPFRFALYSEELSPRGRELLEKLEAQKVDVEQVESRLLQSLSETETSPGLLAVLGDSQLALPEAADFLLILDAVRDPGNLGTLLRSAPAAGVQGVLLSPETVDAFAPKVVRAGMGAHFRVPIRQMTWSEIEQQTRSLQVFIADMQGASCWEADMRPALALIVGGEAQGVTEPARRLATKLVSIPMLGETESLNAAVAGSLLMFEVLRQRTRAGA